MLNLPGSLEGDRTCSVGHPPPPPPSLLDSSVLTHNQLSHVTFESSQYEAFLPTDIMELAATKKPSLLPFAFTFLIHAVS